MYILYTTRIMQMKCDFSCLVHACSCASAFSPSACNSHTVKHISGFFMTAPILSVCVICASSKRLGNSSSSSYNYNFHAPKMVFECQPSLFSLLLPAMSADPACFTPPVTETQPSHSQTESKSIIH